MEHSLQERSRHRLVAGIALAFLLLCSLVQFLPELWPAGVVDWLGTGFAAQGVRAAAVLVVAVALVRQWPTVLREPLAYLLMALLCRALAFLLAQGHSDPGLIDSGTLMMQKLLQLLGYAGLTGAVLTLPARTDTARDHTLIALDALLVAIAAFVLIWLYFIMPGGDDSIRGATAKGVLLVLRSEASPLFDVLLLLVLMAKPRSSKTGTLRGIFGGITVGISLVLVADALTFLQLHLNTTALHFGVSFAHRAASVAFLYAGLRALPPLKDWAPARPAPVERRLSLIGSLGTALLLGALFFEQLDHFNSQLVLLTVGTTASGVVLLARQALLQRRRNLWTAKQRDELERQVAERTAELAAAKSRLELLASEDPLTLLPNRRVFDEALNTAWSSCARAGQPLSVALLDIDLFKAYNDHYGHPAGDACLQQVANILKRVIRRRTDLVARYGGEEFLLLMPQTDEAGAELFAERVRAAIEEAALPHAASSVADCITVSVGVVTAQPDAVSLPERLFFAADAALYEAKAEGRNCVRVGKG
jgi:diguanylate cyclase (GGDEF)-like protein